jgi:hypothetical protein
MKGAFTVPEAITDIKAGVSIVGTVLHKGSHVLYVLFTATYMIVLAYQVYLWIRAHAWTKIPTDVFISRLAGRRFFSQPGEMNPALHWVLGIDLVYTLSIIATIFFVIRSLTNKKVK